MSIPCKIDPLGTSSGGLPAGYTSVEWLENPYTESEASLQFAYFSLGTLTRTQADNVKIATMHRLVKIPTEIRIEIEGSIRSNGDVILGQAKTGRPASADPGDGTATINTMYGGFDRVDNAFNYNLFNANQGWDTEWHEQSIYIDAYKVIYTDNAYEQTHQIAGAPVDYADSPMYCFGYEYHSPLYPGCSRRGQKKWFKVWKNGMLIFNLIPALDPTGVPCMLNLVNKTPFYNQGTGQFIVGLTMPQARDLVNLPVTEDGTLTVSLPWEAQWDEGVQNALSRAATKGWIITVQYRDPEVTTTNIPISFLESTGTQFINGTTTEPISNYHIELRAQAALPGNPAVSETAISSTVFSLEDFTLWVPYNYNNDPRNVRWDFPGDPTTGGQYYTAHDGVYEFSIYKKIGGDCYIDGNPVLSCPSTSIESTAFGLFYRIVGMSYNRGGQVAWVKIGEPGNEKLHLVAALDPTGTPCMYDSVSGQNFYNRGNGSFIAGFDTAEQAGKLATLPDVTAETDAVKKSLTISLPLELAFDDGVQRALSIATARGWTITVQYRGSEVATANLEADFLESDGGQYIAPTAEMQMPLEATIDCTLLRKSVNNGSSNDMYYGYSNISARVSFCSNQGSGSLCCGVQSWLVVGRDVLLDNKRHLSVMERRNFEEQTELVVDGTKVEPVENNDLEGTWAPGVPYLFAWNENNNPTSFSAVKIWGFSYKHGDVVDCNLIPCLDETGTPCMYDIVSDQNFYNANTAEGVTPFIIGFDTTEKAAISLSKLPVTTDGILTVSLPAEAEDTSTLVPAAIDIAKSRGWTIIEQIRTN